MRNSILTIAFALIFHFSFTQSFHFQPNIGQVADASGQVRSDILFTADAPGADLFFFNDGFSYVLWEEISLGRNEDSGEELTKREAHRVDIHFEHSSSVAKVAPAGRLDQVSHYYHAHCPQGVMDVPAYSSLTYHNIYPGIDVVFSAKENGLEYDFKLKSGADPGKIQLRIDGADLLELKGDFLEISTHLGLIREFIPRAFSENTGESIACSYVLQGNRIQFQTGGYDQNEPLIIDPVSTWATYYGGNGIDYGRGVAYNGAVYQAGEAASNNFPVTPGVQQTVFGGNRDAYLVRWDLAGNRIWCTYYGGTSLDAAEDVAVDPFGNIFVAGYTSGNFPISPGAFQPTYTGNTDGFLVKFNSSGNRVYATYLGGDEQDRVLDVASDGLGNAVVAGFTSSSSQISTPGVVQANRAGNADAFIMKFDPAGARIWGTYWGGTGLDEAHGIDTDASNNIIIAGRTYGPFPTGASAGNSAHQTTKLGGFGDMDMFIAKFNPNGTTRLWSTYYGGANVERAYDVVVDGADNVIAVGNAWANFPVTFGVVQAGYGGGSGDAAVVKFSPTGTRMFATYLGSSGYDLALSVDATGTNDIIVGGETDKPFPTANFCQNFCAGTYCGFLVHLNGTGSTRLMSTLLGGSGTFNSVVDVAVDNSSNIFATGFTSSTNYPVGGTNVFQNTYGGGSADAFMGIYNDDSCNAVILSAAEIVLNGTRKGDHISLAWETTGQLNGGNFFIDQYFGEDEFRNRFSLPISDQSSFAFAFNDSELDDPAWFRIRQVDISGVEQYSNVVEVRNGNAESKLDIWPNPANEYVQFSVGEDFEGGILGLYDLAGRLIHQSDISISNNRISVANIPNGLYILRAISNGKSLSGLLEINR